MTLPKSYNRGRTAAIAYLCMLFEGGGTMLLSATKQPVMDLYGIGITEFSTVLTIRSIVCGVMPFFCGGLSDRLGRKKTIVFGLLMFLAFYLLVPQVPLYGMLIGSVAVLGIGYSMVDPAAQALLFDCYEHPAFQLVFIQVAFAGGGMIVPFAVSFLMGRGLSFKVAYWVWLGYCILLFCYVLLQGFPKMAGKSEERAEKMESLFAVSPVWFREGLAICLFTVLNNVVNSGIANYADIYGRTVFGMDSASAVQILSFYQAGCVIGSLASARLVMKVHPARLIVTETAFAFAAMLLAMFSGNSFLFILALFGVGLGTGVQFSLCIGLAGELFWKNTGAAAGAVSSASAVGIALASVLGGALLSGAGVRVYYWVITAAAGVELLSGVGVNLLYKRVTGA